MNTTNTAAVAIETAMKGIYIVSFDGKDYMLDRSTFTGTPDGRISGWRLTGHGRQVPMPLDRERHHRIAKIIDNAVSALLLQNEIAAARATDEFKIDPHSKLSENHQRALHRFGSFGYAVAAHPTVAAEFALVSVHDDEGERFAAVRGEWCAVGPKQSEVEALALSHLRAPRATVAAPGEMIYPASGPSAPHPAASDIASAKQSGYTMHGPDEGVQDGNTKWAYCIDGDYSEEFDTEGEAWQAAIDEMRAKLKGKPLPADPDGQNDDRAEWANTALVAFAKATGCDARDEAIGDLLGNLMHWCDRNGRDFEKELQQGRDYYRAETAPDDDEHLWNAMLNLQSCEVCSAQVSELIGAPCGAEVCRACFDNGAA